MRKRVRISYNAYDIIEVIKYIFVADKGGNENDLP